MKPDIAAAVGKTVATAGTAAAAFGLSWWAVAAALTGAFAAYHFEPERKPEGLGKLIFGIFSVGFGAALLAVAAPAFPLMDWADKIQLEVRAGLLGLSFRLLFEQGRRISRGYKTTGG